MEQIWKLLLRLVFSCIDVCSAENIDYQALMCDFSVMI